jgi:hypothetical protein
MFTLQNLLDAGLPALTTDGIELTQFARELTPAEWLTYLSIADPIEYQNQLDRQALKSAYQTMITRLEAIQAASNPTNAQIVQAIKDEALYIERVMKVISRLV